MERIGFGAFYSRSAELPDPAAFARRVEELGFDSFWAGETPTNRGPSLDAFTALCYAAAATRRITVGSDVLLLPLHNPVWVAKQFGTLDVLSNGRVILGAGVGGEFPKQFEAFGVPVGERFGKGSLLCRLGVPEHFEVLAQPLLPGDPSFAEQDFDLPERKGVALDCRGVVNLLVPYVAPDVLGLGGGGQATEPAPQLGNLLLEKLEDGGPRLSAACPGFGLVRRTGCHARV